MVGSWHFGTGETVLHCESVSGKPTFGVAQSQRNVRAGACVSAESLLQDRISLMLPHGRQQLRHLRETGGRSIFAKTHLQNWLRHGLAKLRAHQDEDWQRKGVLFRAALLLQAMESDRPAQLHKVLNSQFDHTLLSQRHTDIPSADTQHSANLET